jgi:hypothetical protein
MSFDLQTGGLRILEHVAAGSLSAFPETAGSYVYARGYGNS